MKMDNSRDGLPQQRRKPKEQSIDVTQVIDGVIGVRAPHRSHPSLSFAACQALILSQADAEKRTHFTQYANEAIAINRWSLLRSSMLQALISQRYFN